MRTYYTSSHERALDPGETTSSVLLLVFRAQHRLGPPYITDLLEQRATRVLRSTTNNDFYVPPSRSRYGDRIFSVAGPRLWNSLPAEMKKTSCLVTFKRLLKTHLFRAVNEEYTSVSLFNLNIFYLFIIMYMFYINCNFTKCHTHYFITNIAFILIMIYS